MLPVHSHPWTKTEVLLWFSQARPTLPFANVLRPMLSGPGSELNSGMVLSANAALRPKFIGDPFTGLC
jgi:hypothetical protein